MTTNLDIEQAPALLHYLRQTQRIMAEETPQIRVLAGGVSNRTVLVERETGEAWVLKQALTKLRVPVDWFSEPERVHREALGLRWLAQLTPPGVIPALLFEDHTHHLIAMEAVPQPHVNWKTLLLAGRLELAHVEQFATLLATIHGQAVQRQGELAPIFADRSFFESLRLEPYYQYTATQVAEATPFLEQLVQQTRQRCYTLVHGDYSPKNTLLYQNRLILLDYEVIHWGDPAFDVGFSLTHLLSKAHHCVAWRKQFATAAQHYWQIYRTTLQQPVAHSATSDWLVDLELYAIRHTLACMLARAAGRSPLEYMTTQEREHQQQVVVKLMHQQPVTIAALVKEFINRLSRLEPKTAG
ncbi:MAG: aminoglycoside phosphotransferase family protein [Caldilineaceae bacterium]